mgnify:CR=1 FL=1
MRWLALVFLAAILSLQYPMWFGKGGWLAARDLDRQLAMQRDANERLKARNEALDADVRDLKTGNKTNERWRTADTVERLEVRELDCQFLFKEADMYTFMDTSSYEQFSLSGELIGEKAGFLQDNAGWSAMANSAIA